MRIAGDQALYFSRDDDSEARKRLADYVVANMLQSLTVFGGKPVSLNIMWDAKED